MKKINQDILKHIQLSAPIFKYPVNKRTVENIFDPNIDFDFKKYMLIKRESGQVRLSEEFSFSHENPDKILNIKESDILDGTWWVLP